MSLHQITDSERARGAETRARLQRLGIVKVAVPQKPILPVAPPVYFQAPDRVVRSPRPITTRKEETVFDEHIEFVLDSMEMTEAAIITDSVSVNRIIRTVARYYKISVTELLSQRRAVRVTIPRHVAVWVCRHLTTKSLPTIGNAMGGRDHTTMLHSFSRAEDLRKRDPVIQTQLNELLSALRPISQGASNAEINRADCG